MLRSMYSGVSGMKNFQTKLDVIGNNIANVNTVGFKKGRVTFQEMMSQTTANAQGPTASRGGINASQVGLGAQLGSIDDLHTQGFRQTTNIALDIALQGDGMFVVASNTGRPTAEIDTAKDVLRTAEDALRAANARLSEAEAPIRAAEAELAKAKLELKRAEEATENDQDPAYQEAKNNVSQAEAKLKEAKDAAGDSINAAQAEIVTAEETVRAAQRTLNQVLNWDVELDTGFANSADIAYTRAGNFYLDTDGAITNPDGMYLIGFKMDANGNLDTSQHSVITIPNDAESFSIQTDGVVNYIDSDGNPQVAGKIAVANFSNPGGLQKAGDNLYLATPNAGDVKYVEGEKDGSASLISGSLEMSNVDLAEEFTEMITAQRGFQANTRIISTSDEILQELVNLKR